jgi:hypothetical protein
MTEKLSLALISSGLLLLIQWLTYLPIYKFPAYSETFGVYAAVIVPLWLFISVGLIIAGLIRGHMRSRTKETSR